MSRHSEGTEESPVGYLQESLRSQYDKVSFIMYFCIMYFYIIGAKIHLLLDLAPLFVQKKVFSGSFAPKTPLFPLQ